MKDTTYRKLASPSLEQGQGVDVAQLVESVEEFYNKIRFIDTGGIIQGKLIDYYINSTLNGDIIDQLIKIGDLKNNTRIVDAFIGFYKFLSEKDSMRFSVWLGKLADSNNALLIKIRNAEKDRVEELKTIKIHRQIRWGIAVAVLAVFIMVQVNIGEIRSASSPQKATIIESLHQNQVPKTQTQKIFPDEKPQNK